MEQRTLSFFFGKPKASELKRPREEPSGQPEQPAPEPSQAPAAPSAAAEAPVAQRPAAGAAYYDANKAELKRILDATPEAERPTATNMAKLLQEEQFDPTTALQSLWPLPKPTVTATATGKKAQAADSVPYAAIVDVLVDISATSSRLECVRLLTRLLQAVLARSPGDLTEVLYLVVNKQAPQHEGVELGIGDALLVKVVAECCGMTEARAKEQYKQTGDLAEIAQENRQKQATLMKPRPLSAHSVFEAFKTIATMSGKDVMRHRADLIKRLLRDAQGPEVNLIVRALQQKMRIGLAEPSALNAIGFAFTLDFLGPKRAHAMAPEELQLILNTAAGSFARIFYEVPSYEVVIQAVLDHGFMVLVPGSATSNAHAKDLSIRPGLPVKPQLAHPTSGVGVILDRFQGRAFTSEYKYDGERAQIHYKRGSGYQIFSRNSETHTGKYPDVISMLPQVFGHDKVESFILDSEVVAVNPDTGALQAFQVLQHRGRKNIAEKDVTIPVCVFAFDILYFNGEPQLHKNLRERRAVLSENFSVIPGKMTFATHLDSDNVEDIQKFLELSILDGCEGLMIKTLTEEATYTPAKRSHFWLKLKKDYMDGATDTLDLVPMGAFYGKGKRAGVFGGFLLGCYDAESDEYQSICKIGTGFQETELEQFTAELRPHVLGEKPGYFRAPDDAADVWLHESTVWEIKAADLSISPVHNAAIGLVDQSRGIALRFPRFIRVREDKTPTDCTSAQQVAEMYKAQSLAIQREETADAAD